MSQRQSFSKGTRNSERGFSMIEVVIAIAILSIGLLAVALLVTGTLASGTTARYMNIANVLASEKLDTLNRLPSNDPNITCTTTCGALTGSLTCASGDIYCDQVAVAEISGADYETQTQNVNGVDVTTTIVHTSGGCVDTPANCGVGTPPPSSNTFTRRWLITAAPAVTSTSGATQTATGAKRVTVVVTLANQSVRNPVNFEMSMVRP